MIDFRLYRVAWLPALAAFVVMMFSLEGEPEPIQPQIAPTAFDGDRAEINSRQILNAAGERRPGGEGDAAVAEEVEGRFDEVTAGTVATQEFTESVDGEDADLSNVVLTLPGETDRTIVVMAARDSASGPGAASSAAATATLLELADVLAATEHEKTIVLVSTDAGSEGAAGAREFIEGYADRDVVEAAIVIGQPGAAEPAKPHVLRDSTDDSSTNAQLVSIAEQAVSDQADRAPGERGTFADLARLAMPSAAGDQSVLIEEGLDAVAFSSAGERPLSPGADGPEDLDPEVMAQFGSAALATVLVLDQATASLDHGPDAYVRFSGSLIPGWSIALMALALILPAGIAALDGVARAARRRSGVIRSLAWGIGLALPPLATVVAIYVLAVLGLIVRPLYPFDPGRFDLGFGELVILVLLAATLVAGYLLTGLGHPPRRARGDALVPALGAAAVAGALVTWLLNPYLALLLVPAAHVWLIAARRRPPSRALTVGLALLALLPAALALKVSAGAVGAGPWDLVLMIAAGHIGTPAVIALCPIAGALVGLVVLAWSGIRVEAGVPGGRPPRTNSRVSGTDSGVTNVDAGPAQATH